MSHLTTVSMDKRRRILILISFVVIILYTIVIMKKCINLKPTEVILSDNVEKNFLDGCRYVYIDMGTNIGIQIRKLYQPYLYPNAPVLPLFQEIFGNYSNEVCSVGFEANRAHDNYLKEFENYCLKQNWRVKIFTSIAVSIKQTNVTFYSEPGNEVNHEWGASLEMGNKKTKTTIPSIDIVSWIQRKVLTRKIPSELPLPKIMMKSDIEGHDSLVIANLILSGVYCFIDLIYGEHLNEQFLSSIALLQRYSTSCKTKLIYMDDETYYKQKFPFIINNSTN